MNAAQADAPQELQFRLRVDEAHCDRAAQGLRLMAQHQYRSAVRRYEAIGWLRRTQQGIRKIAPAIAVVALIAGAAMLWVGCIDRAPGDFVLAAALFLEAVALWRLPRWVERIRTGARAGFERFFGNRAAAMMRKTRRAVPFEAVYDLRGDLLAYSRLENGRWTHRWHRHLDKLRPRGVALQTPGLLAIFPKPGAVIPSMVVLTAGDGAMVAAIRGLGWTVVDIDPAPGDPAATRPS